MIDRRVFLNAFAAVTLAGAVAMTAPSAAMAETDTAAGASAFIKSLGDRAINTFSDKANKDKAKAKFRALLTDGFDIPYIGRWVLGRFWNIATDPQRTEYQNLFERMIVETYAGRFAEYSGETFKITGTRPEGDADTSVGTQIVRPSGPPINVDWRVRKTGPGYKIIDVVVEGVSMGVTQRSEFSSVINSGGGNFDALLDALRKKVDRAG